MMNEIKLEICSIHSSLRRDHKTIKSCILESMDNKYMQAKTALLIYNNYGMTPKNIYLLCYTHNLYLDLEGLLFMIKDQKEKQKNMVQVSFD